MEQPDDDRTLRAAKRVLGHFHEVIGADFAFELWDGSLIPPQPSGGGLRLAFSADALPRLLRSPRLATLIDLYARGDIDPRGGTLFEFAAKRPAVKTRSLIGKLDKRLVASCAWQLLFAPSGRSSATNGRGRAGPGDQASGSKKADIAFHYDVSNDFYRLFLDPGLLYTCAYFKDWDTDLGTAQADKLDMICRKLRLKPGDRLLDIGCGWGALICHAAEKHGVTAVGVTLSEEQAALARNRIRERGLEDKVTVELKDFRDVSGPFDKIASIGMFEHVGIDNHDDYFRQVRRLLRPRGLYLHHAITRRGKKDLKAFRRKRPEYRTLVRYIFPGGEVDHIGLTLTHLEANGFEVHDVECWREHYARTTRLWAENLMANKDAAIAETDAARYRLWLAYLTGVSLGFQRGTISIFQTVTSRRDKGPSGLPPTREDLYR